MDPVHLHLVLTHFPVVGLLFGLLLLGLALLRNIQGWASSGLLLVALTALLTVPLYITGEAAEEAVEHLPGISEAAIEHHEEAAEMSFIGIELLGAASVVGLALTVMRRAPSRWFLGATFALGIAVFIHTAWTANLGGKIRHPEVSGAENSSP